MRDRLRAALFGACRRCRAIERREASEFRHWAEDTDNLTHLSVLVFVPLLIALVTLLSNAVEALPYLLFPPLASGTYTLFAQPESRYASPRRFVGGITLGAFCGWLAYDAAAVLLPAGQHVAVNPLAAAGAVLLTAVATWALDLEEASAFSSALLVLVIDVASADALSLQLVTGMPFLLGPRAAYVVSVFLSTSLVATVFLVWREAFYEQRASYLYGTTRGDDHVLVPMREPSAEGDDGPRGTAEDTATFAARIAAAHDAGKVVLLETLPDVDATALQAGRDEVDPDEVDEGDAERVREAADRLDAVADRLRTSVGVPCEVVVAGGDPAAATLDAADRTNCDLVVTPYEAEHGKLSPYVRRVLCSNTDAIVHRPTGARRWRRILVPVAKPGGSAHAMVDFATRLAGRAGRVSVCTCVDSEAERRHAEHRLANTVEAFDAPIETRVSREEVTSFIERNADSYDLVLLGSSGARSPASRLVSPPTFERLRGLDSDVAVVDKNVR